MINFYQVPSLPLKNKEEHLNEACNKLYVNLGRRLKKIKNKQTKKSIETILKQKQSFADNLANLQFMASLIMHYQISEYLLAVAAGTQNSSCMFSLLDAELAHFFREPEERISKSMPQPKLQIEWLGSFQSVLGNAILIDYAIVCCQYIRDALVPSSNKRIQEAQKDLQTLKNTPATIRKQDVKNIILKFTETVRQENLGDATQSISHRVRSHLRNEVAIAQILMQIYLQMPNDANKHYTVKESTEVTILPRNENQQTVLTCTATFNRENLHSIRKGIVSRCINWRPFFFSSGANETRSVDAAESNVQLIKKIRMRYWQMGTLGIRSKYFLQEQLDQLMEFQLKLPRPVSDNDKITGYDALAREFYAGWDVFSFHTKQNLFNKLYQHYSELSLEGKIHFLLTALHIHSINYYDLSQLRPLIYEMLEQAGREAKKLDHPFNLLDNPNQKKTVKGIVDDYNTCCGKRRLRNLFGLFNNAQPIKISTLVAENDSETRTLEQPKRSSNELKELTKAVEVYKSIEQPSGIITCISKKNAALQFDESSKKYLQQLTQENNRDIVVSFAAYTDLEERINVLEENIVYFKQKLQHEDFQALEDLIAKYKLKQARQIQIDKIMQDEKARMVFGDLCSNIDIYLSTARVISTGMIQEKSTKAAVAGGVFIVAGDIISYPIISSVLRGIGNAIPSLAAWSIENECESVKDLALTGTMTGLFAEQLALMIVSCCFNDIVKINPSELSNLVDGLMNRLKNIFQENISAEDKTNSIYTIVNKYVTLLWQNQGRTITDKVLFNKFSLEDIYACPNFIFLNEILANGGKHYIESKRSKATLSSVNKMLSQRGNGSLVMPPGGGTKIPTVGIQTLAIQLKQAESQLKKVEEENQWLKQICVRQELRIRALEEQNKIYQPSEADLSYPASIGFFGKRHGYLTEICTDSNFNREMLRVGYD